MKYLAVFLGIVCVFLIQGVYTDEETECGSDVINYINKKINATLAKYTEKPPGNFMITLIYNECYKHLAESIVQKPAKKSVCKKAEAALSRFLRVANNYDKIVRQMEQAMTDLKQIQENPDDSMHLKYVALKIETLLNFSTSIFEAKDALKKYKSFKKEEMSASNDNSDNTAENEDEEEDDE